MRVHVIAAVCATLWACSPTEDAEPPADGGPQIDVGLLDQGALDGSPTTDAAGLRDAGLLDQAVEADAATPMVDATVDQALPPEPDGGPPLDMRLVADMAVLDMAPPVDMAPPADMTVPDCRPGELRAFACGQNDRGRATQRCTDGAWGPIEPCEDPDVCVDDTRDTAACGLNDRGQQIRVCAGGQWGAFDDCADPDVCVDGAQEAEACGVNDRGERVRICAQGRWGAFGACADMDLCDDGAQEAEACGLNDRGERVRICAQGRWSAFGACDDPDVCVDGAREAEACGLNDRGERLRICAEGRWGAFDACDDPDVCVDGAREADACGLNARGERVRRCAMGRWGAFEACADPDVCEDGRRRERPCAVGPVAEDLCRAGAWVVERACAVCADDCAAGARRCEGDRVAICGDVDDDPCLEWGPPAPCGAGLRCDAGECVPTGEVLINEVFYDAEGADSAHVFIELSGPPGRSVAGLTLVAIDGRAGGEYATLPLAGAMGADGYYLVTTPAARPEIAARADLQLDGADLQNGPDGVQLRAGAVVLDALGYGEAPNFAGEGRPAADVPAGRSLSRRGQVDTDDNAADFVVGLPSPRAEEAPADCVDGTEEARPCGLNGRGEETRRCADGRWTAWGVCADPDVCSDGAVEESVCGLNRRGVQTRRCVVGRWVAEGCVDPDVCVDTNGLTDSLCSLDPEAATCLGAHRPAACGLLGRAVESVGCEDGQVVGIPCRDLDVCEPDQWGAERCGINERGTRWRLCRAGRWPAWGDCMDPDACPDGDERTVECPGGERAQRCIDGQWRGTSPCVPTPVNGYVEGSYAAFGILRVARTLSEDAMVAGGVDAAAAQSIWRRRQATEFRTLEQLAFGDDVTPDVFDQLWDLAQARAFVPRCGDGEIMQPDEACDDGNNLDGDGCDARCQLETVCGDGVVDGVEDCDDGALADDECTANCRYRPHPGIDADSPFDQLLGAYRALAFTLRTDQRALFSIELTRESRVRLDLWSNDPLTSWYLGRVCPQLFDLFERDTVPLTTRVTSTGGGMGLVECPEEGVWDYDRVLPAGVHRVEVDLWPNSLREADVHLAMRAEITPTGRVPDCGDGVRGPDEACDDGNRADGDGCSATCAHEILSEAPGDGVAAWPYRGLAYRATGQLGPAERDRFRFTAQDGWTTLELLDPDGADCRLDARLSLQQVGTDAGPVTRDALATAGRCDGLRVTLQAGRTYEVAVTAVAPGRTGPYALRIVNDRYVDGGSALAEPIFAADPAADCAQACARVAECGADADACRAACDAETLTCIDETRRHAGGCVEIGRCVAELPPIAPSGCDTHCDAIVACDPAVERLGCEVECRRRAHPEVPGACTTALDVDRFGGCEAHAACEQLPDVMPAACRVACADVEACGLFANRDACEAACAAEAALGGADFLDALQPCIAEVAACSVDLHWCFAPPACPRERGVVERVELTAGSRRVVLRPAASGDDDPPVCGGRREAFAELRLRFPARVHATTIVDRFFLTTRCDVARVASCRGGRNQPFDAILDPGLYYLGAEAGAFDDPEDEVSITVSVTPLSVERGL